MASSRSSLWRCPACGRRFAKSRQWHSCSSRSVDHHFRGKDTRLRRLFDLLIQRLKAAGPLRVDAVKTSVNLISSYHLGGVKVQRDGLRVGFLAESPIDDPRIVHTLRLGPRRVSHAVVIRNRDDIDAKMLAWLRDAQALQAR